MTALEKHAQQHMPRRGPDSIHYAVWHIALSGDRDNDDPVVVEDNVFRPPVSWDMDKLRLKQLELGLGVESSSGDVELMIHNETQAVDMLSNEAVIPAGDKYADATAVIEALPDNQVEAGDILVFNVIAAGTGAMGLKAVLTFW